MKIALTIPDGVDRRGTGRVMPPLLALIPRLVQDHELHIFAMRQEPEPSRYELLGARVGNIGGRRLFRRRRAVKAIRREHRRAPFDVLHAVGVTQGLVAARAGRRLRRPAVLHLTDEDLAAAGMLGRDGWVTRGDRKRLDRVVERVDGITVASDWILEKVQRLEIAAAERLTWGVDIDTWPQRTPEKRPADRPVRLLHVADLSPPKDQETLLRAGARLAEKGVDFRLDIVGTDRLGGEIQELAGTLGLPRRVTFHGTMPHAELREHIERADMLVVSSLWEAGPTVALEAAVAGVPTVGTAVGHVADWAPEAALAVTIGDDAALAAAIKALLEDEDRRLRVATAAQERALRVDADTAAERTLEIYAELAGRE